MLLSDLGMVAWAGALAGILIGTTGGALARLETHQVAVTAALWGTLLGPMLGLLLLVAALAVAGVGM